jgi:SAM-dependent methyltransferase
MRPQIYGELSAWYHLLDPLADHEDEGTFFREELARLRPSARTLLELGAGAGNNAAFMKQRFECTLTDLSPAMLELSRVTNPDCEHVLGDMRSLRLGRQFDVVFVHDAVMYMQTEAELRDVMVTAFEHLAPGGALLLAPDGVREGFADHTELYQHDLGARSLRCIEWVWDPDPSDTLYWVEYSFLLREGESMRAVHDRHLEGIFPRQTWLDLLTRVGFVAKASRRLLDDGGPDEIFIGEKPAA